MHFLFPRRGSPTEWPEIFRILRANQSNLVKRITQFHFDLSGNNGFPVKVIISVTLVNKGYMFIWEAYIPRNLNASVIGFYHIGLFYQILSEVGGGWGFFIIPNFGLFSLICGSYSTEYPCEMWQTRVRTCHTSTYRCVIQKISRQQRIFMKEFGFPTIFMGCAEPRERSFELQR